MDRNLRLVFSCWMFLLVSVSTLTRGAADTRITAGTQRVPRPPAADQQRVPRPPPAAADQQRIPRPPPPPAADQQRVPRPPPPPAADQQRVPRPPPPPAADQQRVPRPPPPPPAAADRQRVEPPSPRPVSVRCLPDSLEVVVQADLLDTGLQVHGAALRLGSSPLQEAGCGAEPSGEAQFTLRANLLDCGIKLSSTEEKIIYSTVLVFSPEADASGLLKLEGASFPVECHYEKKYSVDAFPLQPTWIESVSTISADDQIDFNVLLMSDDWQRERGSSTYFLGDPVNVEVSTVFSHHVPMRVYVDRCVATATANGESATRYSFIEHHGCLTDAYVTNSKSRFLPRVEDSKLKFKLDAFRFYDEPGNQVFITCQLKAVPSTQAAGSETRACSFIDNSWRSADGSDHVCSSCDLFPPPENRPTTEATTSVTSPIRTSARPVQHRPDKPPATYVRFRPGLPQNHKLERSPSPKVSKRGTNHRTDRTVELPPIIVLPSRTFGRNLSDPKMTSAKRKTM